MMDLNPNIDPMLTEYVIKLLGKRDITTVLDFLKADPLHLTNTTNLSFDEVFSLKNNMTKQFGPSFELSGIVLYEKLIASNHIVRTGIDNFDELLEGGLKSGNLYEVCGLSAVGKTQICNTIAVNLAINHNWETLYVDAKNDFSGTRIFNMLQARDLSDLEKGLVMERIFCETIYDVDDFMKVLNELPAYLVDHKTCKFVVVDSLPVLWFPFLGETNTDGMSLLSSAANLMKQIAIEHQIIFLLVNIVTRWKKFDLASEYQQVTNFKTKTTVALGNYWHSVPMQRFLLSTIDERVFESSHNTGDKGGRIKIQIIKGNQSGKSCVVNITNKGVVSS